MITPLPCEVWQSGSVHGAVDTDQLFEAKEGEDTQRQCAEAYQPTKAAQEQEPKHCQGESQQGKRGGSPALEVGFHLRLRAEGHDGADHQDPDGCEDPDPVARRFGGRCFRFHGLTDEL